MYFVDLQEHSRTPPDITHHLNWWSTSATRLPVNTMVPHMTVHVTQPRTSPPAKA
jgi:hypothetical protein